VLSRGDVEYLPRRLQIGVVILALIAGIGAPEITFRVLFRSLDLAGHKTPTERRKGHEADAELAQNRVYLRFQIPFP
jgi:hypothetical protein